MGQKANPCALRLNISTKASSNWYAEGKEYVDNIQAELKMRQYVLRRYKPAGVGEIFIERPGKNARIIIRCARPGMIIGKKGSDVETLRHTLEDLMKTSVHVSVEEIRRVDLNAKLVAEAVAGQLERRVLFRKAMKRAVQTTMRAGAKGIKILVSGRLGGAEIARSEMYKEGRVPLHTFRADIDYSVATAMTTYGIIGVKVWIYRGDVFKNKNVTEEKTEKA
ncbi:MAG TPA: 30S ribosomal protein S3 [Gammaproteobacteria bacterium]|nr:30S ribosomal protein S3 [Gammaproteobacteria bacterium]